MTRLASIEAMAGMDMLCSDKTGTLTLNKMVIQVLDRGSRTKIFGPACDDMIQLRRYNMCVYTGNG